MIKKWQKYKLYFSVLLCAFALWGFSLSSVEALTIQNLDSNIQDENDFINFEIVAFISDYEQRLELYNPQNQFCGYVFNSGSEYVGEAFNGPNSYNYLNSDSGTCSNDVKPYSNTNDNPIGIWNYKVFNVNTLEVLEEASFTWGNDTPACTDSNDTNYDPYAFIHDQNLCNDITNGTSTATSTDITNTESTFIQLWILILIMIAGVIMLKK